MGNSFSVSVEVNGETRTFEMELGEMGLGEMVQRFGEGFVRDWAMQAAKNVMGQYARRLLKKGKSQEEIAKEMATWRPGTRRKNSGDPVDIIVSRWAELDNTKKAELLRKLKELSFQ